MGLVKGFSAKNGRDRGKLRKRIVSVAPALPSTMENSSALDPFLTQSLNVYIIISWYPSVLSLGQCWNPRDIIHIQWEIECEAEASAGTSRSNRRKPSILHGLLRLQWDTKQQKYDCEDNREKPPEYQLFTTHLSPNHFISSVPYKLWVAWQDHLTSYSYGLYKPFRARYWHAQDSGKQKRLLRGWMFGNQLHWSDFAVSSAFRSPDSSSSRKYPLQQIWNCSAASARLRSNYFLFQNFRSVWGTWISGKTVMMTDRDQVSGQWLIGHGSRCLVLVFNGEQRPWNGVNFGRVVEVHRWKLLSQEPRLA